MQIHPEALAAGITHQGVLRATEQALLTTHNGNGPTLLFILGRDDQGRMLEVSAIVRHEDILVVHADEAREVYLALLELLSQRDPTSATYGHAADGVRLTDHVVESLATAAAKGHDVEFLLDRTRPGRPAPMTFGTVVRVALDRELSAAVRDLAGTTGVSLADLIDKALHEQTRTHA